MQTRPLSILVLSVVGACASQSADPLRDQPPAALLVAIAPVTAPQANRDGAPLQFTADGAAMQRLIIDELRTLDAASMIVAEELLGSRLADYVVGFHVEGSPALAHEGVGRWFAAGGLWLTTWIGGLAVADSNYSVDLKATCTIGAPERRPLELRLARDSVELSFLERNAFWSWPTLQSLIVPPFWTSDDVETTSAALSATAMRRAAHQIAVFLKNEFEPRCLGEDVGSIRLIRPLNGERIAAAEIDLSIEVVTVGDVKVGSASAVVEGKEPVDLQIGQLREDGNTTTTPLRGRLSGLEVGGEAYCALIIQVGGATMTRTLRLGGHGRND